MTTKKFHGAPISERLKIQNDKPFELLLRDARPEDFPKILGLNQQSVHLLSHLTLQRLEHLHEESAYHRVVEIDGTLTAFLLALREKRTYDSPNYQWFASNFDRFVYIDRVVVSVDFQGHGLGGRLYADLFDYARNCKAGYIVCEFDIDPPNEISRRFHQRHGFREVARQMIGFGAKQVSLQAVQIHSAHNRLLRSAYV